jgi:sugar-specific transcriptional regulator TrmB
VITLSREAGIQAFERLGLTRVEAEVYVHLVQHSPATGYAIAKAIGRTQGATYKVLASLEARGAIIVDDAEARQCRAIPPEELLGQLERRFLENKSGAADALRGLIEAPADERVYQLATIDQVFQRCHAMLTSARWIAVVDAFPGPLAKLRQDIVSAAGRGVRVAVEAYEPAELPGVRVALHSQPQRIFEPLPVQWISLHIDGKEHLHAALSKEGDRVLQAIWSASLLLSWSQLGAALFAMQSFALSEVIERGDSYAAVKQELRAWRDQFPTFSSPGFHALRERFGMPALDADHRRKPSQPTDDRAPKE